MKAELAELHKRVCMMGEKTMSAVDLATRGMFTADTEAAANVREIEKRVDLMYYAIDEYCLSLLASRKCNRHEVDFTASSLKIAMELERVCDYANQIAKLIQKKFSNQNIESLSSLNSPAADMRSKSLEMLGIALKAYAEMDGESVKWLQDRDLAVDKRNKDLFRDMICLLSVNHWLQEIIMDYHTVIRYVERVADRATNIAEMVFYIVHGEPLRKKVYGEEIWHD